MNDSLQAVYLIFHKWVCLAIEQFLSAVGDLLFEQLSCSTRSFRVDNGKEGDRQQ